MEPIEEIVCKSVHLLFVGIYKLFVVADRVEIKSALGYFDQVLYFSADTIKKNYIRRFLCHHGNNKGVHMNHLIGRFFNLEDDTSWLACLIFEFSILDDVVGGIVLRCFVQCIICFLRRACAECCYSSDEWHTCSRSLRRHHMIRKLQSCCYLSDTERSLGIFWGIPASMAS